MTAPNWTVHHGDVLAVLPTIPDASVDCCVTSPPYWGLRDYGTASWDGGDAACDHIDPAGPVNAPSASSTLTTNGGRGPLPGDKYQSDRKAQFRRECGKCRAVRVDKQLGLESTPAEYVERLVEVFREVRRVLKDDGTLWLNLGDSYMGGGGGNYGSGASVASGHGQHLTNVRNRPDFIAATGLKAKDLCGIPWRVAFALQADGWYLRSDIIWSKPNPMPESVTDRPTKAHEYLFLLAKSERYHYAADLIAEESLNAGKMVKTNGADGYDSETMNLRTREGFKRGVLVKDTRNRRSVWTIPSEPFPGAHFAVMPTALVKPCVLAGCRPGGTVLDPFTGSGTVGYVALENGCGFVGVELNAEYVEIARERIGAAANAPTFDFTGGVS